MKMKKWLALAVGGSLILSLALAGCGTKPGGASSGSPSGEKRDTLILGHWSDPPSLDPNNALNDCAMRVTTNVYDTLVRMDGNFTAQPCIAESWDVSADGLEYTFKIRDGVKFHNGDLLTVDDVCFSLQRGIDTPKASPSFSRVDSVERVDDHHV